MPCLLGDGFGAVLVPLEHLEVKSLQIAALVPADGAQGGFERGFVQVVGHLGGVIAHGLDAVDDDLLTRMHFIRKIGNIAAHDSRKISKDQAMLCLENLYIFMDFLAYCYADSYTEGSFDSHLVETQPVPALTIPTPSEAELKLDALMKENAALREQLTNRREQQKETYVPKPLDISEYKTRKLYIDAMLVDAGWTENQDWLNEYEVTGMPNEAERGYADYVLLGSDGKILAVIEAKRTCVDV